MRLDEQAGRFRRAFEARAVMQASALGAEMDCSLEELARAHYVALEEAPVARLEDDAEWRPGVMAEAGVVVQYESRSYRAITPHLTQADWTPDITPSLWKREHEEFAPWYQPSGAHDAYMKGDRVTHLGGRWESTVDHNTWEPGIYGWKGV